MTQGNQHGSTVVEWLIVVAIILMLFGMVFPTGMFVGESKAVRALETQGYRDVKITGKAIWFVALRGGDSKDAVRFSADATNPIGQHVKVYVFSGWLFKASTIRTP